MVQLRQDEFRLSRANVWSFFQFVCGGFGGICFGCGALCFGLLPFEHPKTVVTVNMEAGASKIEIRNCLLFSVPGLLESFIWNHLTAISRT